MKNFLIVLWHATKSGYHNWQWPAHWLDQEEAPKYFQSQTCTQKIKDHNHSLVVCCWSDPLQLSESWQNHYIWEVGSANWWAAPKTATPAVSIGQQAGPTSSPWQRPTAWDTTKASKDEWIGLQSFASSAVFTWPLAKWLPLYQASWQFFFQGKLFHNQQEAENAFHEFVKCWHMDFYNSGINKLISCWQNFVDCNHSYFDS